jgi:hypothetical protein
MRWSPPRGALLLPALNQRPIEESKKGVLADFGSSKMGSQALMQVAQAKLPAANLARGWSDLRRCGIILLLHVFLVSDGRLEQERFVLVTVHLLVNRKEVGNILDFRGQNSPEVGNTHHCSGQNVPQVGGPFKCYQRLNSHESFF